MDLAARILPVHLLTIIFLHNHISFNIITTFLGLYLKFFSPVHSIDFVTNVTCFLEHFLTFKLSPLPTAG